MAELQNGYSDKVSDEVENVYKTLEKTFEPAAEKLARAGRELCKALIALSGANQQYVRALETISRCASDRKPEGAKHLGECFTQLTNVCKRLESDHQAVIRMFNSQVLEPLESNVQRDPKAISVLFKHYQNGSSQKRKGAREAEANLSKFRRRSSKENMPEFGVIKEREYDTARRAFELYQAEALTKANAEERKRYAFILERQCALLEQYLQLHKTAVENLQPNLPIWRQACDDVDPTQTPSPTVVAQPPPPIHSFSAPPEIVVHAGLPPVQEMEERETPPLSGVHFHEEAVVHEADVTDDSEPMVIVNETALPVDDGIDHDPAYSSIRVNDSHRSRFNSVPETPTAERAAYFIDREFEGILGDEDEERERQSLPSQHGSFARAQAPAPPPPPPPPAGPASPPPFRRPTDVPIRHRVETPPIRARDEMTPPGEHRGRAIFPYMSLERDRLMFQPKDVIRIIKNGDDGWQYGENQRTTQRGWYPASYLDQPHLPVRKDSFEMAMRAKKQNDRDSIDSGSTTNDYAVVHKPVKKANSQPQHVSPVQRVRDKGSGEKTRRPASEYIPPTPLAYNFPMSPVENPHRRSVSPTSPKRAVENGPKVPQGPVKQISVPREDTIVVPKKKQLHRTNYDTIPKDNPFSEIKLRHVITEEGVARKYI